MENLEYSKILKKYWEIIALIAAIVVVIVLIVCLFQPFQYSAETKILVIQKQEGNLDAYTATKSAERIARNLVSIIYTSSFYNDVLDSNTAVAQDFPQDGNERKKVWSENVKVSVTPETGIIEIKVYDIDRKQAAQLVKSIAYVLVDKGSNYHGGGSDVSIKLVDDVFLSKYPVRPNIVFNIALAVILGIVLGVVFVILRESSKMVNKKSSNHDPAYNDFQDANNYGVVNAEKKIVIKTMYDHVDNVDNV